MSENNDKEKNVSYPSWISLWFSRYVDMLNIDNIPNRYKGEALDDFLKGVGTVFIDAIYVFQHYYDDAEELFPIRAEFEMLYNMMINDVNRSFEKYEKTCIRNKKNGEKGGRPPRNTGNDKKAGSTFCSGEGSEAADDFIKMMNNK